MIGTIEGRGERGMQEPDLDPVEPVNVDKAASPADEAGTIGRTATHRGRRAKMQVKR